jgi:HD-GYP domain-containing protein (c-di-GMP phosphodiesterase class II)
MLPAGLLAELGHNHMSQLSYCGILHDIGKSKISPEILNKPDALTEEEFDKIKQHLLLAIRCWRATMK